MRMVAVLQLSLLSLAGLSASAQVTGGQAPPDERKNAELTPPDIEVKSPLLVQVLLATKAGGLALPKRPFDAPQTFKETRQYVCDKARVEYVTVIKHKASHDKIRLVISAKLSTEWFAQTVDLTLGLYDGEKQIKSETWNKVRIGHENVASAIGVFGSDSSRSKEFDLVLSQEELDRLFAEGRAPSVRVLMAIHD